MIDQISIKNRFRIVAVALFAFLTTSTWAGEGMWLPHLLKTLNEKDMKAMGCKLNAEDIYSINKGSLKDAIVHFGGFCTSEVISDQGLLLTNHHCGYGNIQSHSSIDNNLLKNGFWAKSHADELANPGLFATFIDRIEDITSIMLKGVDDKMNNKDRQSTIDKNLDAYKKTLKLGKFEDVIIRPFFAGNQYLVFFTTTYNDVRLVGTPPEAIGKFGSDTDNWVWPRHTGDFSLFRIYAGPNNEPADYSANNKPYKPKHFLPINIKGVKEGDFTMVFGFPGRTDEYLPSEAVNQVMEKLDPAKVEIRDIALKIMDKHMRTDEAIKLKYAAKYANIANYWKKWLGEMEGLEKSNAVDKKKQFEVEFNRRAAVNPAYKNLVNDLNGYYGKMKLAAVIRDYFSEIGLRNVDVLKTIPNVKRLETAYTSGGDEAYKTALKKLLPVLEDLYKDLMYDIDKEMAVALLAKYEKDLGSQYLPSLGGASNAAAMMASYYDESIFKHQYQLVNLLNGPADKAIEGLKADKLYNFANEWMALITTNVNPEYVKYKALADSCQVLYMKGQMELFPEKKFYPDANSTLRVTYGKMQGYNPRDAVYYSPTTYLEGVIEKYVPGDYEFDVPPRLLELYKKKDYGQYADKNGKLPICFLGSNHTTGGNSGSPAIDARGNLIGLNFDRVWEGTMSDINYDPSICRNIMVDARYILFIIDKYAGAGHLIKEMKLVK